MTSISLKEKIVGRFGSVSGIAAFLGSYQVCHTVCMWIISLLAIVGIAVVGMPLLFLQKIAVPVWIVAVLLLLLSFYFYRVKKCLSGRLLLFNVGVLVAGVPFASVQTYSLYFWIVGGAIVVVSILLFLREKFFSRRKRRTPS